MLVIVWRLKVDVMEKKIFQSILNVTIIVLLSSLILVTGVLHNYFQKIQVKQLKDELSLAALGTEQEGLNYLSNLNTESYRITWIASDGNVLFDNQADIMKMENHGDREEFLKAVETGFGSSSRRSITLTENTFYEAKLLSDGTVLRVSMNQKSVFALLLGLIQPFGIILTAAIVAAYFIAEKLAKQIIEPLEEIDLEYPLKNDSYEEMAPFLDRIYYQQKRIKDEMQERIQEQMNAEKMRREFSANVSHELKTPLQSIIGSAEIIQNNLVKKEDMPRFIGHIHKEASRLVALIEDIIRLSELDEEQEIQKEEVSLHQIASDVLLSLQNAAEKREVTLKLEGSEGKIEGVYRLLHEVIYNLCDNAIKYNVDGGSVNISIEEKENEVGITIEDTGIGIPLEHQSRIFERFYRVDKSHSKKSGGTGLGLSIVKHAVGYHNGKINLSSEEGKGTRITILFPLE